MYTKKSFSSIKHHSYWLKFLLKTKLSRKWITKMNNQIESFNIENVGSFNSISTFNFIINIQFGMPLRHKQHSSVLQFHFVFISIVYHNFHVIDVWQTFYSTAKVSWWEILAVFSWEFLPEVQLYHDTT